MRLPLRLATLGVMLAFLATACGAGGSNAPSNNKNIGPIRIALMGIFSGPNFTAGGDNAFKMAVDEINKSGGISGRQVEYKEFDAGITPQGATNATSLALQYQPTVFMAYPVSAGLKASIDLINQANVPVIHTTLASLTSQKSLGSDLSYRVNTTTYQFATGADDYLFKTLGVKKMMIINTSDSAPTEGGTYIEQDAQKNGVTAQRRSVSPTVTDLTEPVLAAKAMGAQAIWEWGYPTTDGLLAKTAAANGYDGYLMTFSAGSAARNNLIPASMLTDKVMAVNTCAPYVLSNAEAKRFVSAYKSAYGKEVDDSVAANQYDLVYILKDAILAAGSSDPKAVAGALKKIDHKGVCGQEKTDSNGNLIHTLQIIKYTGAGGAPVLVKDIQNISSPF